MVVYTTVTKSAEPLMRHILYSGKSTMNPLGEMSIAGSTGSETEKNVSMSSVLSFQETITKMWSAISQSTAYDTGWDSSLSATADLPAYGSIGM